MRAPRTDPPLARRLLVTGLLFAIAIFGMVLSADLFTQDAKAIGGSNTIVTVKFFQSSASISVKPGVSPIHQFKGDVQVSRDKGAGIIFVTLSVLMDTPGFLASISPVTATLQPNQDNYTVTLNVMAPVRANFTDNEHPPAIATVSGRWLCQPSSMQGEVADCQVMVGVEQFYDLSVSADPPFHKGWPGTSCLYRIYIKNMGNGADIFEMSVLDDQWYTNMGFQFSAPVWQIEIPANSEGIIELTVVSPQRINVYEIKIYAVTLKVVSKGSFQWESQIAPRSLIYDVFFQSYGMGIFLYFSWEFWVCTLILLVVAIVVIRKVYVKKKGIKTVPISARFAKLKQEWADRKQKNAQKAKAKDEARRQEALKKQREKEERGLRDELKKR